MIGVCALCLETRELQNSHIVPALIARWIKKDAPGTRFVNLESGAVRQDISRRHLLCQSCEQLFSGWETHFRSRVFDPYLKRRTNFGRAEWFTRFAVSLAFRVGVVTLSIVDVGQPERQQRATQMFEAWRRYLLSPGGTVCPSVHELFFLLGRRRITPPVDIPPEYTARYLTEAIDPTLISGPEILGVYTKLPAMLIWSPIEPQDRTGWQGTRIDGAGIIRANKQRVTAPFLTRLIHERIRLLTAKRAFADSEAPHENQVRRMRATQASHVPADLAFENDR